MQINILKTELELLSAIALYFINIAKETVAEQGAFNVSLSGGNSPKILYELLSSDDYKNQIDWSVINFFYVDERYAQGNC